jgi:Listeria-Bacteroides repeat domain (List_Bact_rpt)/Fibronectin type III domain/Lectin C-type domain
MGSVITCAPSIATGGTITSPASPTFSLNTAGQDPGDFVISGFDNSATLLVSIGFVDPPASTTFSLPTTTGLTAGYGYNFSGGKTQISFTGSQANANAALAAMTVATGNSNGNITIRVTASINAANVYYNPINNSFYEFVSSTSTTGSGAFTAAAGRTLNGVRGYLVTITSAQENSFVSNNISAPDIWIGATDSSTEGTWVWGDGPEANQNFWTGVSGSGSAVSSRYVNWCAGEPNDWGSGEDYAVTNWGGGSCWNDYGAPATSGAGSTKGYVVEYSQNWGSVGAFTGIASAEVTALVSNAPRNVSASRASPALSGELVVSWQAPLSGTVTSYSVTSSPESKTCTPSPATGLTCTVTGLTNGTTYTFTVTATFSDNSTSTSLASSGVSPASTPLTVTFDTQGGSAISAGSTIVGGSIASSPGVPTRTYFSFLGWFAASSGGTAITFPYVHGRSSDFALYAQWSDTRKTQSISLTGETLDKGATTTLSATGYSGTGSISYSLQSGDCSLKGAVLTATSGVGNCQVGATIDADSTYQSASTSATFIQRTRSAQTITFSALSNVAVNGAAQNFSATSSSGLSVSVLSTNTAICSVSGNTVKPVARGTCTLIASQSGNSSFLPATDVSQSFTITGLPQTITFAQPAAMTTISEDQKLAATSTSGLAVSFRSTTTTICQVSGTSIVPIAAGTCTVSALQIGDGTYATADEVARSIQITYVPKSPQRITISPVNAMILGQDPQQISVTSSTTTTLQVAASPSDICTIDAQRKLTAIADGQCIIKAIQSETRQLLAGEAQVTMTIFKTATISKRLVSLDWERPSTIDDQTPLSAAQLNASANVPGKYVYSPSLGAKLPGGINDLTVVFTPDDSANFLPVTLTVKILVRRASTPTPTPSPTASPTPSITSTPTPTSTPSPKVSPSSTPTPSKSPTPSPSPSRTAASPTPRPTTSPTSSSIATPAPSISASFNGSQGNAKVTLENVKPGSKVKVTVRTNVK